MLIYLCSWKSLIFCSWKLGFITLMNLVPPLTNVAGVFLETLCSSLACPWFVWSSAPQRSFVPIFLVNWKLWFIFWFFGSWLSKKTLNQSSIICGFQLSILPIKQWILIPWECWSLVPSAMAGPNAVVLAD